MARIAPLAFIAPSVALSIYDHACVGDDPGSFETAAHALATALRMVRMGSPPIRPAVGSKPRLIVSNPPGQPAEAPRLPICPEVSK